MKHQEERFYAVADSKFALFIDLENCGAKVAMLNNIIDKVKIRGDLLLSKVYGYTDSYSVLKQILLSNTFTVVPSIKFGHNQKNNLDIQLVIDALEVAYANPLIDSFCIVSGDSDYTPLVGKLKSMGKFVLGISRSEAASSIFINACTEFVFLESVPAVKGQQSESHNGTSLSELSKTIETILGEQAGDGDIYASEVKNILLRLHPDFSERNYGCASFSKLLQSLETNYKKIQVIAENFNIKVRLRREETHSRKITKDNWMNVFQTQLNQYKESGFERINPSILKASIQNEHPDFDEKQIGFKRFSDIMKCLEREKRVTVELDEAGTMLVKIN